MAPTSRRRTRFVGPVAAIVAAAGVALVGCATNSPGATSATTGTAPMTAKPAPASTAPPATRRPDEGQGAFLFRSQCAGCHGSRGEGNLGPSLVGIADRMSEAEQIAVIESGKGQMPPFAPGLTADDIAAVVAYSRTELQ